MIAVCAWILATTAAPATVDGALAPAALVAEYRVDPLGLGTPQPRLSWQLRSTERDAAQGAYEIEVYRAGQKGREDGERLWDTGRVDSGQSLDLVYGGPELVSGERCTWRVRVWDRLGHSSAWSADATFELGLLRPSDWTAGWIAPGRDDDPASSQPVPLLRREFQLARPVRAARLYATSLGLYEMEINGRRVGDDVLAPGWTEYDRRLNYQTYDVTALLRVGANAIGAALGDGRYRGNLGVAGQRNTYGERLGLLAQLRIIYADGSVQTVGTDTAWRSSTGPVLAADFYDGEVYDARRERPGWTLPGYDDRDWAAARPLDRTKEGLVAPAGPPVRRIQELKPVAILRTPAGDTVFDLGQNMVGWVRLKVQGPAGTVVNLRHAEVLDHDGNFYTENLRAARQTDRYTLRGSGEETFEPRFTLHGFRYVAVSGYPGAPTRESITGIVVHADMAPTGRWESSHVLLNRLQHNITWGQKGNFVDAPTDCPQRNERLGWTGDAQIFARTAAFNFDVAGFFTGWLADLAAAQKPDGAVPWVVPDVFTRSRPAASGAAGWGDAAVIIPWTLYLDYGDVRVLATQYPSMKAWVEWMRAKAPNLVWDAGFQFGDWLAYAAPSLEARSYPGATTGKDLAATAFFAHSADLLSRAAAVLGRVEDARRYAALFADIKAAFNREFVTPAGRVGENTQTAYVLALRFDLLPPSLRAEAARRLAADLVAHHNHLTTGFLGTPYLCPVLSEHGQLDVAYSLLEQESYPSWLYPVKQGATTIWERWDGIKPDGTFQDPRMNSFNHYAYGAVGEWMYRTVAGIDADPADPGYRHVLIQPQPGGGLRFVRATLRTRYGEVASAWELAGDALRVSVRIPANAWATVRLPAAALAAVKEAGRSLDAVPGVTGAHADGDSVVARVGSGEYAFVYPSPALAARLRRGLSFGLDDTVGDLLAGPETRAVFARRAPGFLASPAIARFQEASVRDAAEYLPQLLTREALDAIGEDLGRIRK